MPRHSHQDAVPESVFRTLVDSTEQQLNCQERRETKFVLIAAGRLGLRAGEIAHVKDTWVDWEKGMIEIPAHEPCEDGRNGGVCGYCRKRAEEAAQHDDQLTLDAAIAQRWNPKTRNSARAVPFDFDEEVEETVEQFFFHEKRYDHSRASINRRVDTALDAAGYPAEMTYPHALRATAATYHAYQGLNATALQHLFGWASLGTAMKYIRKSGSQTQDALHDAHGD